MDGSGGDPDTSDMDSGTQPRLLTPSEVAQELRVSVRTLYRLIRGDALPAIRVGKQLRISQNALESWLERPRYAGVPPPASVCGPPAADDGNG